LREVFKIRQATGKDISTIHKTMAEWLDWRTPQEESIRRAINNKELLVADRKGEVMGFIHSVMHEDIIDGGPNSFITCFYVTPEFRNKGVGSRLLGTAINDALDKGAIGIEASTASPDARRFYEKHSFKQFKGKWTMGEVFLELDIEKHRER
jgi:GNAT superfamily N-acetyltransferase